MSVTDLTPGEFCPECDGPRLRREREIRRRLYASNETRRIERYEDGSFIEAQLTSEGVIVDYYGTDGELAHTFGRMYDELLD